MRKTSRKKVIITQPKLPTGLQPLVWGQWPTADEKLYDDRLTGTAFSFVCPVEYGQQRWIAVCHWNERQDSKATVYVIPLYHLSREAHP